MTKNSKWKKHGIDIPSGTNVTGKWYQKTYRIIEKIGAGAVGSVYLCTINGRKAALKISKQGTSMTVEVNVLKSLQKVREHHLGPYLLDTDDWEAPWGETYSFYVMEYIEGESMASFIRGNGAEWIGVFMLQLLDKLDRLHQTGWVFGDLKLDNILIDRSSPKVRFVDVGGTTQTGRAIKEYTEFYDRGYWGLGSRKAEPSYDLFSLVMVFLAVFYPNHFPKTTTPEQTLFTKIDRVKALVPYRYMLKKAISGKYTSSAQMKHEVARMIAQRRKKTAKAGGKQQTRLVIVETFLLLLAAAGYYASSLLLP
ncbi:protein kinase domain-containing protein [Virgibacillus sp. W0181]|uniref:protein kinase domain-containing protein n=1 Tax=Virgibacillus sp. W0181 TaxID=3391581 RepID=UPI003F487037